jgi:hypothetical protein
MTGKGLLREGIRIKKRAYQKSKNPLELKSWSFFRRLIQEKKKTKKKKKNTHKCQSSQLSFFFPLLFSKTFQTGVLIASYPTKRTIREGVASRNMKRLVNVAPCVTEKTVFFFFLLPNPFTFSLYINFKNLIYYSRSLITVSATCWCLRNDSVKEKYEKGRKKKQKISIYLINREQCFATTKKNQK